MKKVLIVAMAFLFVPIGLLFAQSRMTEDAKEEAIARHQAYMEKLSLTEEQKPKVEEINMSYFEGLSKIKKSNGGKLEKYRTFKKLSSKRDDQMKIVLTKEQFKIYKKNQAEQRENFKARRRT